MSFIDAYFGEGNGAIHLDNIHCMGYEPDLLHCVTNGIRNHNCQHNEDVGVKCEGTYVRTCVFMISDIVLII